MIEKLQSAVGVFRKEGFASVLRKIYLLFVTKFNLSALNLPVTDNAINSLADKMILVEGETHRSITYNGSIHDDVPSRFASLVGNRRVPEKHSRVFYDATLVGPPIHVVIRGDFIIPDIVGWSARNERYKKWFARHFGLRHYFKHRPTQRLDSAFVLAGSFRGVSNFGLWFYEMLPKLYWYEAYCSQADDRPTLVVPPLRDYQEQSLRLMGYDPEDVYQLNGEKLIPEKVILPPQPGWSSNSCFNTSPLAVNWVRQRLLANRGHSADAPERIYISREDADFRFVVNEREVYGILKQFGFERISLSGLDLREQIKLFAAADTVIGPHGAGMAHMINSTECLFIEFFPGAEGMMPQYFVLANALNHDYDFLICTPGENENSSSNHPRHHNIIVNPSELKKVKKYF